jgi:site-specific DNA recombinase
LTRANAPQARAVYKFAGGPALLQQFVVGPAGQAQGVDVGAVGGGPVLDVVDFAPIPGHIAARARAATILRVTVTVVHPKTDGMNSTNTATRAAIYARISNDPGKANDDDPRRGGDGLGVKRQQQDWRKLASQLGWEVVAIHVDNDISAYNGKTRPGFEALLDAMKRGEIDAVVCWHTDRLYRSMKDLERLIEIAYAANISIRNVQVGELDLSTSAGRMVARILGSVGRQESEHMSERRIRFNEQKAEAGKWQTANRTFGYTMDGQPLEPEASAVRQAVVDVLAGKSIQQVARDWNAAGLKTTLAGRIQKNPHTNQDVVVSGQWTGRRVRRLLVNPKYAGIKTHTSIDKKTRNAKVEEYQGNWTPVIDLDTHRGLVGYLSDPSRIKCTSYERKYPGSNLYICGKCGGPMKAAMPGNAAGRSNNRKSRAYTCRDHAHVLRAGEPVDDYVTATVLERITQPDAADLLANKGVDIGALSVKREALQRTLDKITDLFNDDQIDAEQFGKSSRDTRNKLAVIDRQLADATRVSPAAALVATGANGLDLWQAMSPTQRAQAVDEIAVVTIKPCPPGLRKFDSDYVDIAWRRGE